MFQQPQSLPTLYWVMFATLVCGMKFCLIFKTVSLLMHIQCKLREIRLINQMHSYNIVARQKADSNRKYENSISTFDEASKVLVRFKII